jgi:hypothetical protein
MKELEFRPLSARVISAVSSFVGQGLQIVYGFITGMFRRTAILGTGNVMSASPPCSSILSAAIRSSSRARSH